MPEPRVAGQTTSVSIMEGCSRYCTFFWVVPCSRGEEISRPFADVIAEVARPAGEPVVEYAAQQTVAGCPDDED